jgi:tagaturonate reductase
MSDPLPETVLQFGTGKFLRCFVDLFVDEANRGCGQPLGRVVAVQSTGIERADAINAQQGRYHAAIRGLAGGERVDRTLELAGVSRALAAGDDWPAVLEVARSESLRLIVSNTTEAGLALDESDQPGAAPPRSFPAKLLAVLLARQDAGLDGVTILPCELVDGNADRLRELVLEQAGRWGVAPSQVDWLRTACCWHNTLVDRIVSAPPAGDPLAEQDPLYAVTEPFALWLIEGAPDLGSLGEHPAVQLVEHLAPYALRKVRILNGAHTALVAKARPLGFETVREAVANTAVRAWLEELLFDEIIPTIADRVDQADAEQFARDVLERFANPFLDHRLADIALHHEVKLGTRLVPTYKEYRKRFGLTPRLLGEVLRSSH